MGLSFHLIEAQLRIEETLCGTIVEAWMVKLVLEEKKWGLPVSIDLDAVLI
jgi:hypothetical protein